MWMQWWCVPPRPDKRRLVERTSNYPTTETSHNAHFNPPFAPVTSPLTNSNFKIQKLFIFPFSPTDLNTKSNCGAAQSIMIEQF